MMDKLRDEVEGDVARLLAMLEPTCNPETFMFVRDKLTNMVIVSVTPASGRSRSRMPDALGWHYGDSD